jgi:septal ring factor EnvC (AmiA/AmiB activator)
MATTAPAAPVVPPAPTASVAVPLTTRAHMIRQAGIQKLSQTHKQVVGVCQLRDKVQTLKLYVQSHGTMPLTTSNDVEDQMQGIREELTKAKYALDRGTKSMADLEKLEETLEPLHKNAELGDFPKDRFATLLTEQHRMSAWRFLVKTTKHRSPNENEVSQQVLGAIQYIEAKLEADGVRTAAEIAMVMGTEGQSWSVDEVFEVSKTLRGQLEEQERDLIVARDRIKSTDATRVRYRTERNTCRLNITELENKVKELENKAAEVSMADASLEETIIELVSPL